MSAPKPWTEHETQILNSMPNKTAREIQKFLPGRSIDSILQRRLRTTSNTELADKIAFWKSCNLTADEITWKRRKFLEKNGVYGSAPCAGGVA
ncbi:hypothetical protein [Komagataeibacter europaeus]|uniref:hypothetical protein n=1 Tax=Komagataeibacter europaeus TaxID=33995 RepID=UPI0002FF2B3F|nr:hypothetical protein [Komagataeibacter europaeus]